MHLNEDWLENILTDATSTDRDALILKYETELDQKNRQIEDLVKTIEDQRKKTFEAFQIRSRLL